MIVVDSGVWIDYFNGVDSKVIGQLDALLGAEPVAVGDLILAEVLQGFRNETHYKTAKELMLPLTVFEMLGQEMAMKSADNYRALRANDVTVRRIVDVIIATFALITSFRCSLKTRTSCPSCRTSDCEGPRLTHND